MNCYRGIALKADVPDNEFDSDSSWVIRTEEKAREYAEGVVS
jgi:hypothetical protein